MRISCLFGHIWNGCKCTKCEKTRDIEHDWSKDCEKCSICDKKRDKEHDFDSMFVCRKCNTKSVETAYKSFRSAIEKNDIELVKKYLSNKYDVEYVEKGLRGIHLMPITMAVSCGKLAIVELMLESGANIYVREYDNYSLLHHANSSSQLVEYLIKLGLDVNDTNNKMEVEPLYKAETAEVVDSLVKAGARVDYSSYTTGYRTPLRVAIENKRTDVIKALLKHGANIYARDARGDTPSYVFQISEWEDKELVELFNKSGKETRSIYYRTSKKDSVAGKVRATPKTGDKYVDDCFTFNFPEWIEIRKWHIISDAESIVDAKRAGNVKEAIQLALALKNKSPDYYFSYYWLIHLYSTQSRYKEAEFVLIEGLKLANQKQDLCDAFANCKWSENKLGDAVKWWIKSVVLQISSNNIINDNPFLYLSYVSESLGLRSICAELRVFVDRLTSMGRLNTTAIAKLYDATNLQGNPSMKKAIEVLSKEFLINR